MPFSYAICHSEPVRTLVWESAFPKGITDYHGSKDPRNDMLIKDIALFAAGYFPDFLETGYLHLAENRV